MIERRLLCAPFLVYFVLMYTFCSLDLCVLVIQLKFVDLICLLISNSLVGQHIENVSSSHGKGKITKSEFESKVSSSDQGGSDPKSALNASSNNLKNEVGK